jgi:hypothetical protein
MNYCSGSIFTSLFKERSIHMRKKFIFSTALVLGLLLYACDKKSTGPDGETDNWFALPPLSDQVQAMTVFNGDLIAGGVFKKADELTVNYIARWDGTAWQSMGSGLTGAAGDLLTTVYAMTVYDDKLIVAGHFRMAGGIFANNIAAWDGTSWSVLGSGINATSLTEGIMDLAVYQGNLIAGGVFLDASVEEGDNIVSWDGSFWNHFNDGIQGTGVATGVTSLLLFNNNLIAGGSFNRAGTDVSVSNIAIWNGTAWTNLGSGTNQKIWDITEYAGDVGAAGDFTSAGGVSTNRIAIWDGTNWSACGTGMNGRVEGITVYNNDLIAGGSFSDAGGTSVACIARWNGTSWSKLGNGVSGGVLGLTYVAAFEVLDGKLYVGGNFTKAGNKTVGHVAYWQD